MIPAGLLTIPIEILEPTIRVSPEGEQVRGWDKKIETFCGVLKRSGKRENNEGNIAPSATRTIILRYRPGITIYDRVRFVDDDEIFMIDHPEPDKRNNSLTLHLKYLDE